VASHITRLEPFKPPAGTSTVIVDGPKVIEIARDRQVPDGNGGYRTETEIVTFTLADQISSMLLLEMGAVAGQAATEGDTEGQQQYVVLVWRILLQALPKGEFVRFQRWADTAKPAIEIPELIHYIGQMIAVLTGRPTQEQSPSPHGLLETQTGSTAPTESVQGTGAVSAL